MKSKPRSASPGLKLTLSIDTVALLSGFSVAFAVCAALFLLINFCFESDQSTRLVSEICAVITSLLEMYNSHERFKRESHDRAHQSQKRATACKKHR